MSVQIFVPDSGSSSNGTAIKSSDILANATASAVSDNVLTTILTLSPSVDTFITQVVCSGDDYGKFTLVVDASTKFTRRGGPGRDVVFQFVSPFKVAGSSVFDVKVEHFLSGATPNFQSTVLGYT